MKDEHIFISYSRKNEKLVNNIVEQIEQLGQKVFIDYKDIKPGAVFADEIVTAIENSLCCVLILTKESNVSTMVFNEINSATNHNKIIIPLIVGNDFTLSKTMEFYISKNNWIVYENSNALQVLIETIKRIKNEQAVSNFKYETPIVLSSDQIEKIGYDARKRVIETIEIDYRTLNEASNDFVIDSQIEGTPDDWMDYASNYTDMSAFLVVKDRVVGYYQIEVLSKENYLSALSGKTMVDASQQEFCAFGGELYCYIVIMPIVKEYENQSNYLLLFNSFVDRIVDLSSKYGIDFKEFAISVYSTQLEKMVNALGFKFVGNNPAKGKVFKLDINTILSNPIYKKRYPNFVTLWEN